MRYVDPYRYVRETVEHLHWDFGVRTAQLRVARVTLTPARYCGALKLSQQVCYVRFFANGETGFCFRISDLEASRWEVLPALLGGAAPHGGPMGGACVVIEERFKAHLATRALTGQAMTFSMQGVRRDCCPDSVGERQALLRERKRGRTRC